CGRNPPARLGDGRSWSERGGNNSSRYQPGATRRVPEGRAGTGDPSAGRGVAEDGARGADASDVRARESRVPATRSSRRGGGLVRHAGCFRPVCEGSLGARDEGGAAVSVPSAAEGRLGEAPRARSRRGAMTVRADAYDGIRRDALVRIERRRLRPEGDLDEVQSEVHRAVDEYQRRAHLGDEIPRGDPGGR